MKVVLFCGGHGMRMRSEGPTTPKPMTPIGTRPILWHIMRAYAHFGHKDFILCLGYGAEKIKEYFLNYSETTSNDFVLSAGGSRIDLLETDITDWRITFAHTGEATPIGERLRRVREHLDGDEVFLANYGDGVSNVDVNDLISRLPDDHAGSLLAVRPQDSFHVVAFSPEGALAQVRWVGDLDLWVNGGFFVLRQDIFEYLPEDGDLVMDGCRSAGKAGRFSANRFDGFWACMDTIKERAYLEGLDKSDEAPWKVWRTDRPAVPAEPARSPAPIWATP